MPNREWGRDEEQQHHFGRDFGRDRDADWMRDERWRRDMGRDFSRHEWSPYDRDREMREMRDREMRDREMRDRELHERQLMREREMRGDFRNNDFGYGGTDRDFRGGGWGGYGGRSMAERSMGDRGMYQRDSYYQQQQRPMGRAPRSYQRSDERIKEDVCDRLMSSWIDAENVELEVRSGEVILSGTVEDRQSKRAIEDLAEQVLGVKDVQNNIRVQARSDGEHPQQPQRTTTTTSRKPTA